MTYFAERKTCVRYSCYKFGVSENNMSAEVSNKMLKHNFDVPDQKILVAKLVFVF